ncbi:MAG: protein phosphatase CheZ [Hyphomicrobiales bacterium]
MSETPLATMSQDGEDGDMRPASGDHASDTTDLAPAAQSGSPISDADYEAIAAAVMETERGRWFLKEYARRNRNSDTQTVLNALERLEDRISVAADSNGDTSVALISHNVIDLAEAITQVKREVQELGGNGDEKDHFNSATVELEAIVTQTETATGEILEAAEKIQEVLWILREEGANETQCDIIESKIIDVYTACSFQDLTGQRSSKVVRLVGYVEKRVSAMMEILGLASNEEDGQRERAKPVASETPNETNAGEAYQEGDSRSDAHLLHGPALEGEAIEQDDVDALFGGTDATDDGFDAIELEGPEADTASAEAETFEAADDAASEEAADGTSVLTAEPTEPETSDELSPAEEDQADEAIELTDIERDLARLEEEAKSIAAEADESGDDSGPIDIITDDMVVEIHDAEILRRPAEDALIGDALAKPSQAPDIFDVDALDFDGPDMSERALDQLDSQIELHQRSPRDDRKMMVDMPDDFAVDEGAADMFVDTVAKDQGNAAKKNGTSGTAASPAQDIFDVDELGVDDFDVADEASIEEDSEVTIVAKEPEEKMLDEALEALAPVDAEESAPNDQDTAGIGLSETGDEPPHADNSDEDVPYTDEERIALFS